MAPYRTELPHTRIRSYRSRAAIRPRRGPLAARDTDDFRHQLILKVRAVYGAIGAHSSRNPDSLDLRASCCAKATIWRLGDALSPAPAARAGRKAKGAAPETSRAGPHVRR